MPSRYETQYLLTPPCHVLTIFSPQVRTLFERHRKTAWFLEKYDPRDPYLDLRNRVRKTGWEGAVDKWVSELEEGKHDPVPDPAIPAIAHSSSTPANGNGIAVASTSGETNDNPSKSGPSETPKREDQDDRDDESGDERERGPQDGDEIIVPQKGHQVMIKTIPPDIGRLRLEPVRLPVNVRYECHLDEIL